jgi:hypothetical protein
MTTIELTLIGKPGCHLCDDAELAISQVLEQLASEPDALGASVVTMQNLNMLESEELTSRYSEEIPVLLINGQIHNYWHIDQQRLRAALLEASK